MANCKDCIKQDVCNRDVGHGYSVCPHYLSADFVEVVRCEDCKYYQRNWLPGLSKYDNYGQCTRISFLSEEYATKFDDDFCSYGIRKGGEG